jgi:hypothetical protein
MRYEQGEKSLAASLVKSLRQCPARGMLAKKTIFLQMVGSVLQIAPDFNEIERGRRRENIAPHLCGLRFLFRQVSVQLVFRNALAAVELRDAEPNFFVDRISIVYEPPILLLLRFQEM